MLSALHKAKKEFNDVHDLLLPKITTIKVKLKKNTALSDNEKIVLDRYNRIASLIKKVKDKIP